MINILTTVADIYGTYFECGGTELPYYLSYFGNNCIKFVKILVPVILIVLGMIDMFKAFSSQKEDEMKKAQQIFVKRLISGALVFLVITAVQFLFSILSSAGFGSGFTDCMDQIVNGTAGKKVDDSFSGHKSLTIVYGDGSSAKLECLTTGDSCDVRIEQKYSFSSIGDWVPVTENDFLEGDELVSDPVVFFSETEVESSSLINPSHFVSLDVTLYDDITIYACYKKQQVDGTYLYKCGNLN